MQGTGHGQQTGATESDDMTNMANMTNMTRKYQKIVFKVDLKGSDLTPEQKEKIR